MYDIIIIRYTSNGKVRSVSDGFLFDVEACLITF